MIANNKYEKEVIAIASSDPRGILCCGSYD
jgi:hypothetical protein